MRPLGQEVQIKWILKYKLTSRMSGLLGRRAETSAKGATYHSMFGMYGIERALQARLEEPPVRPRWP